VAPNSVEKGRVGEAYAADYLTKRGLEVVQRNFHCAAGEIDIICADHVTTAHSVLIFVEVKFRRGSSHGGAAAAINAAKQRRIRITAGTFLKHHPHLKAWPCRFDALLLSGSPKDPDVTWIKQAF